MRSLQKMYWYLHVVRDTPTPVDAAHEQFPHDESTATAIAQFAPVTPAHRRGGEGGQGGSFVSLLAASRPAHTNELSRV